MPTWAFAADQIAIAVAEIARSRSGGGADGGPDVNFNRRRS